MKLCYHANMWPYESNKMVTLVHGPLISILFHGILWWLMRLVYFVWSLKDLSYFAHIYHVYFCLCCLFSSFIFVNYLRFLKQFLCVSTIPVKDIYQGREWGYKNHSPNLIQGLRIWAIMTCCISQALQYDYGLNCISNTLTPVTL